MDNKKTTYILGAGASIGAFPTVKGGTNWGNQGLAVKLIHEGKRVEEATNHTNETAITKIKIANALKDTGEQANIFGNIDSYAKYLYHKGEIEKLQNLKIALTYYFVYKQLCKNEKLNENRYVNFVTSLITEQNIFPEHVKILNWNYDYLIEIANGLYAKESFYEGIGVARYSPPFARYFPQVGYAFNLTHPEYVEKNFSIVHLNGIAGFYVGQNATGNQVFRSIFNDLTGNDINKKVEEIDLIEAFHRRYINDHQLITFAWEKRAETKDFLINTNKIVNEIIADTKILVIIGYSFPFYNREIDNEIFEIIAPTLTKIYFQDPNIDGEFLRERYNLDKPGLREASLQIEGRSPVMEKYGIEIKHIDFTDQFYIPVEV